MLKASTCDICDKRLDSSNIAFPSSHHQRQLLTFVHSCHGEPHASYTFLTLNGCRPGRALRCHCPPNRISRARWNVRCVTEGIRRNQIGGIRPRCNQGCLLKSDKGTCSSLDHFRITLSRSLSGGVSNLSLEHNKCLLPSTQCSRQHLQYVFERFYFLVIPVIFLDTMLFKRSSRDAHLLTGPPLTPLFENVLQFPKDHLQAWYMTVIFYKLTVSLFKFI